jgi:hypothetical protein
MTHHEYVVKESKETGKKLDPPLMWSTERCGVIAESLKSMGQGVSQAAAAAAAAVSIKERAPNSAAKAKIRQYLTLETS